MKNRYLKKIATVVASVAMLTCAMTGAVMTKAAEEPEKFTFDLNGRFAGTGDGQFCWIEPGKYAADDEAYVNGKFAFFMEELSRTDEPVFIAADNSTCRNISYRGHDSANGGNGTEYFGNEVWVSEQGPLRLLNSQPYSGEHPQATSLALKMSNGEIAQLKNFNITFTIKAYDDARYQTAFSFRSDSVGQLLSDDKTAGYDGKVSVFFNGKGFAVYDGVANAVSYEQDMWTAWSSSVDNADITVTIGVLDVEMTIKATTEDAGTIYDNSEDPIVLDTEGTGYIYFSAMDGWDVGANKTADFSNITCTRLDDNGNAIDFTYDPFGKEWKSDGTKHWREDADGNHGYEAACAGGTATCSKKAVCDTCGHEYGDVDANNHVNTETRNKKDATCTEDGNTGDLVCVDCQKVITPGNVIKASHDLEKTEAKAATCTENGNIEYYTCKVCGKLYKDAAGTQEIAQQDTAEAAKGHDLEKVEAKAATTEAEGNKEHYACKTCGKLFADAEGKEELQAADVVIAKLPTEDKPSDKPADNKPADNTDNKGNGDSPKTGDAAAKTVAASAAVVILAAATLGIAGKKKKAN